MPEIHKSALVNYSALQMFNLVNDVARYAEFLPGCVSSRIIDETEVSMLALMELKKGPIRQTFTTSNTLVPGQSIKMELQEGPFHHLHGVWQFIALTEDACKVGLDLDFAFSNRLTAVSFGSIFNELTSKLVDSFVTRAGEVYGS